MGILLFELDSVHMEAFVNASQSLYKVCWDRFPWRKFLPASEKTAQILQVSSTPLRVEPRTFDWTKLLDTSRVFAESCWILLENRTFQTTLAPIIIDVVCESIPSSMTSLTLFSTPPFWSPPSLNQSSLTLPSLPSPLILPSWNLPLSLTLPSSNLLSWNPPSSNPFSIPVFSILLF